MEREWLARRLEEGASYEEVAREVGKSPSTVSYWAKKHRLASSHEARHAERGPIDEHELRALVADGASLRAMAQALDRSPTTVRHWLARYGLRTPAAIRVAEGRAARSAGTVEPVLTCPLHGPTRHVERDDGFRCARCRSEHVTERRRRIKLLLIDEAGGGCILCGYDRCPAALQFHHLEPSDKAFQISAQGVTRALAKAREEAAKCVLLCANCHAEVERGFADLPVRSKEPGSAG
jgi:predicted transcriptional regulator